jgi:osmotically-inducible protein OsmY
VTLTGTVDLYQRKLDAAKLARKTANVQGVRNLITVAGPAISDAQLEQKLARKLRYVRVSYDNTFDYFAVGVKDGVVTVEGADRTGVGRDEALADIANMPGVKDVVSSISIEPVSLFDDELRLRAARVIYRDSVLSKYAIDPAHPIRIIVENGHVTLYGSVDSAPLVAAHRERLPDVLVRDSIHGFQLGVGSPFHHPAADLDFLVRIFKIHHRQRQARITPHVLGLK